MNKVILMGRLTRDPDIRASQNENSVSVARFTVAVDRRFKRDGDQSADFISCVAFGKTAEFIERYTKQGTKLCLEGRIQTGSYNNKDGQKVYTTDVVVENVEFAESKAASAGTGSAPSGYTYKYQAKAQDADLGNHYVDVTFTNNTVVCDDKEYSNSKIRILYNVTSTGSKPKKYSIQNVSVTDVPSN